MEVIFTPHCCISCTAATEHCASPVFFKSVRVLSWNVTRYKAKVRNFRRGVRNTQMVTGEMLQKGFSAVSARALVSSR